MRFKPLFCLFILFLSCSDTPLFRSGANYFPLTPGSLWKYLLDGDTVYVEVKNDTVILNQNAIQVERNSLPEFYLTSPFAIQRLTASTISRPGAPDTVEFRFGLLYQFPLILGSTYGDQFETTLVYGADTVRFSRQLSARVSALETVTTPAGTYYDCYRIDFNEKVFSRDTTETAWTEWLAPDIGVARRQSAAGEEILVEYQH